MKKVFCCLNKDIDLIIPVSLCPKFKMHSFGGQWEWEGSEDIGQAPSPNQLLKVVNQAPALFYKLFLSLDQDSGPGTLITKYRQDTLQQLERKMANRN